MTIAERVYEIVETMTDQQARQVLNFVEFLKDRKQDTELKPMVDEKAEDLNA